MSKSLMEVNTAHSVFVYERKIYMEQKRFLVLPSRRHSLDSWSEGFRQEGTVTLSMRSFRLSLSQPLPQPPQPQPFVFFFVNIF